MAFRGMAKDERQPSARFVPILPLLGAMVHMFKGGRRRRRACSVVVASTGLLQLLLSSTFLHDQVHTCWALGGGDRNGDNDWLTSATGRGSTRRGDAKQHDGSPQLDEDLDDVVAIEGRTYRRLKLQRATGRSTTQLPSKSHHDHDHDHDHGHRMLPSAYHAKDAQWAPTSTTQQQPQQRPYSGLTLNITNGLSSDYTDLFIDSVLAWQSGHVFGTHDAVRLRVVETLLVAGAAEPEPESSSFWKSWSSGRGSGSSGSVIVGNDNDNDSTSTPTPAATRACRTVTPHELEGLCREGKKGEITICNGNYGRTPWVGVEVTTSRGTTILKSRVRLNDYHLGAKSEAYRRYALCHELGHAVGLGHLDTDFGNPHKSSCLDYTRDGIEKCQHPNVRDYMALSGSYGHFEDGTPVFDPRVESEPDLFAGGGGGIFVAQGGPAGTVATTSTTTTTTTTTPPIPQTPPPPTKLDCSCPGTCTDDFLDAPNRDFFGQSCRQLLENQLQLKGYYNSWKDDRSQMEEVCVAVVDGNTQCATSCDPRTCPGMSPTMSPTAPTSAPTKDPANVTPTSSPTMTAQPSMYPTSITFDFFTGKKVIRGGGAAVASASGKDGNEDGSSRLLLAQRQGKERKLRPSSTTTRIRQRKEDHGTTMLSLSSSTTSTSSLSSFPWEARSIGNGNSDSKRNGQRHDYVLVETNALASIQRAIGYDEEEWGTIVSVHKNGIEYVRQSDDDTVGTANRDATVDYDSTATTTTTTVRFLLDDAESNWWD